MKFSNSPVLQITYFCIIHNQMHIAFCNYDSCLIRNGVSNHQFGFTQSACNWGISTSTRFGSEMDQFHLKSWFYLILAGSLDKFAQPEPWANLCDLERPLNMLQSAPYLLHIFITYGRTYLILWSLVLINLQIFHSAVDHPNMYTTNCN